MSTTFVPQQTATTLYRVSEVCECQIHYSFFYIENCSVLYIKKQTFIVFKGKIKPLNQCTFSHSYLGLDTDFLILFLSVSHII